MIIGLEYHDVVAEGEWDSSGFPGPAAGSYKLSIERFKAHLDSLRDSGAEIGKSVRDAIATAAGRQVVLTFDDGGSSAAAIAALLDTRGWKAHLFVTTDRIGTPGFLKADDIRALHAGGHVIGAHSASHPTRMSVLTPAQQRAEWDRSLGALRDILGARIVVASVPGGYYSRAVAEVAAAAGIGVLFTSEPVTTPHQVGDCVVLGRYTLRQGDPAAYAARLAGDSGAARSGQWLKWNLKKAAKRLGGSAYLQLRNAVFGDRR